MIAKKYKECNIVINIGDLLEEEAEAIVNPANSLMIMGGGVAGIIKMM
jgi:O-acetyl-ADP-ribose deacetylase (regulator of RNase III)